jgi:endonuclease YncB( thermonuclease family)
MKRPVSAFIGIAVALLYPDTSAKAEEIKEFAVVMDGATLLIRTVGIRLAGIDAPGLGQRCVGTDNIEWACGLDARRVLAEKIGNGPVSCRQLHFDSHERVIATCVASQGDDLSAAMVRSGYALADGRDPRYLAEEAAARLAGKGLWSGSFQTPWEWRAQQRDGDDE